MRQLGVLVVAMGEKRSHGRLDLCKQHGRIVKKIHLVFKCGFQDIFRRAWQARPSCMRLSCKHVKLNSILFRSFTSFPQTGEVTKGAPCSVNHWSSNKKRFYLKHTNHKNSGPSVEPALNHLLSFEKEGFLKSLQGTHLFPELQPLKIVLSTWMTIQSSLTGSRG